MNCRVGVQVGVSDTYSTTSDDILANAKSREGFMHFYEFSV